MFPWVRVSAILTLGIVEIVALEKGIDHAILVLTTGLIAGVAGYTWGKRK